MKRAHDITVNNTASSTPSGNIMFQLTLRSKPVFLELVLRKYNNVVVDYVMASPCVMDRLQTSGELQDKISFIDPSTGVDLLKGCSPDYLLFITLNHTSPKIS
jgi:hypothetical protein